MVLYFLPERVAYDKRSVPVAETQVDTYALFTMPFNGELVTACQEKLFVDSRDRTAALDFFSAQTNRVLVRAAIFTDMYIEDYEGRMLDESGQWVDVG